MELSSSKIKKYLSSSNYKEISYIFQIESFSYILRNGTFLYQEMETPKNIPYTLGNGTFLYFGKRKSPKNFLYFGKRNFLAPSLKSFLYFSMEIISAEARKISVLAFVRFRRGRIGALTKKLLKHVTAVFCILNDMIV